MTRIAWVSDDTTGAVIAGDTGNQIPLDGEIDRIVTVPDGGGTAPTTLYDVQIVGVGDIDVAQGALADRSDTVTEEVFPRQGAAGDLERVATAGGHTLAVQNAGNSNGGTIYVFTV